MYISPEIRYQVDDKFAKIVAEWKKESQALLADKTKSADQKRVAYDQMHRKYMDQGLRVINNFFTYQTPYVAPWQESESGTQKKTDAGAKPPSIGQSIGGEPVGQSSLAY